MINVWVLYQDIGNIPRSGVHLVSSFLTFNKRPLVYNRPQDQICPKLINDPSLIRATHGTFFKKLINDPGRLFERQEYADFNKRRFCLTSVEQNGRNNATLATSV